MKRSRLSELEAVAVLAMNRNFRRSALLLGMSPSALSHSVTVVEERLGIRLFNRTTRSVSITEAGQRFLDHVRPALQEINCAIENANEFRTKPVGTLRISANEISAQRILAPIMCEFLRRYPDMHVELVVENNMADIVAEGFDAGIRLAQHIPKDMIAVPYSSNMRFAVVGSPQYFSRFAKPIIPNDLTGHNCIRKRLSSGGFCRWGFEKRGKDVVVDVQGSLALNNHSLMIEAALRGIGLIYTTEWVVDGHMAAGCLIRVLEDWTPSYPGHCLFYPGRRHLPAGMRAFVDLIHQSMRDK